MQASSALAQTLSTSLANGLSRITGNIIRRGDDSYPSWWAGMTWYIFKPKRYPDVIVRAKSSEDAAETIRYAHQNEDRVAVRSTGHNPARAVLRDGGILLDLSQLRDVEIDAENRTAWIQPGIRANELYQRTAEHGLVFPAAHTGMVGLGGYLLGGGIGWNMPEYGIACRSVLGAEVILADGNLTTVSEQNHPELLWAIRGAGPGFFGAVVRYKIQLQEAHTAVEASTYVIPIDRLDEALEEFDRIGEAADPRLEILIKIGRFHPTENPYPERDIVCVVQFFAFANSPEEATRLLTPVAASRVGELSIHRRERVPVTYRELYIPPETDQTSPARTTVENMWTEEPGEALRKLAKKLVEQPPRSPRSFLLCGWSFNSTFEDSTSCVRTGGRHYMSWYMIAEQEADIEPNYIWMDEAVALMRPYSKGHYINEIDPVRYPKHVAECFAPDDWERLRALRVQYDPDRVFHDYIGPDAYAFE
ncbi:FAD-binding oxidoreductase [Wenzhouxiangellaceae bacterium CH-27]|uniref:FAD-binding oxidoreductase n=1 Tax=Elongatibacter sediminis TaxID=3119006 RepID=A0AAW9R528_9GAMM